MNQIDEKNEKNRNLEPLRVVFCGTPDFAVPTLEAMIASEYRPVLVVTQPDRPRGRGQRLAPTPVKEIAVEAGLPIHQPEKLNSDASLEILESAGAVAAVVVAYSAKIGKRALSLFPKGWLNLHPSLLPAYRGAAPMQWALINGESRTGITTFFLNEEWDAGPICLQRELEIAPDEDYGSLSQRCAVEGAALVLESLRAVDAGTAEKWPQEDSAATFAPLLKPEDSIVDWNSTSTAIHNRVRGLSPRPGAYTEFRGKRVRLVRVCPAEIDSPGGAPGRIVRADGKGLIVATGLGSLAIERLQPENRSVLSGVDFVNGFRVQIGDRFG